MPSFPLHVVFRLYLIERFCFYLITAFYFFEYLFLCLFFFVKFIIIGLFH